MNIPQLLNFSFVPVIWRTTTVMATSVVWMALMSRTHAKLKLVKESNKAELTKVEATSCGPALGPPLRRDANFKAEVLQAPSFDESCKSNSECLSQWKH